MLRRCRIGFCLAALLAAAPAYARTACIDGISDLAAASPIAPQDLLTRFPLGGVGLMRTTQELVARNVGTMESVVGLVRDGNPAQQVSIIRGLGQAASQCEHYIPAAAQEMRSRVNALGDVRLASAFISGFSMGSAAPSRIVTAQAQAPGPAEAAGASRCYQGEPPANADAQRVATQSPEALLEKHRLGGGGLSSEIRALAITDPALLAGIIRSAASASPPQKTAIAAGLAQAANACEVIAPGVTQAVQRFVIALGDPDVERTFASITGDRAVGAVGGVAGGPGAAASGGGGGPLGSVSAVTTGNQGENAVGAAGGSSGSRFSFNVGATTVNTDRPSASQAAGQAGAVARTNVSP